MQPQGTSQGLMGAHKIRFDRPLATSEPLFVCYTPETWSLGTQLLPHPSIDEELLQTLQTPSCPPRRLDRRRISQISIPMGIQAVERRWCGAIAAVACGPLPSDDITALQRSTTAPPNGIRRRPRGRTAPTIHQECSQSGWRGLSLSRQPQYHSDARSWGYSRPIATTT